MKANMNTFGKNFRISIFGESHGNGVGVTLDGVKPGIPLSEDDFIKDLLRRNPEVKGTTPRKEKDKVEILSGIFQGKTTGAPLTLFIKNKDKDSSKYEQFRTRPRLSHSDFTAYKKYKGFADYRGGGHFSGRLTAPLVVAGVVAKKMLPNIKFDGSIISICGKKDYNDIIDKAIKDKDTLGGLCQCTIKNLPIGLGEPFFDDFEAVLAHLVFSVPGVKGIEFGSGFQCSRMKGSEFNDPIVSVDGTTTTNNAGGINGGITNSNDIVFNVAIRPASSIGQPQETINLETGEKAQIEITGRHDVAICLRVPVILEACSAIVCADFFMQNNAKT